MKPAGIILAGGASRRMGQTKALLQYRGETFVERLVRIFSLVCDPVVVVTGHEQIEATARVVSNLSPERGQLSSLQTGLGKVTGRAVMFSPVDYPAIAESTVLALAECNGRAPVVVPRCEGRHGHPVLVSAGVAAELLALPDNATAREVIHRYSADTMYVDVDDPGILRDVDQPADYEALVRA